MGAVDLHTHTIASDGTLAPRDLVRRAAERGVKVLAITDHDSTDGLAEALEEARGHPGLTIVPGLEINCDVEGGRGASEVHVLGYLLDYEEAWFQDFLRAQRAERAARVHRIAARLAELGLPIDPAEVFAIVKEGSPGRPHVARVMVKRGYVKSVREAFDRYLHTGGPAHVPRKKLTPAEAVAIIRKARGVPVLAHPGLGVPDALVEELVGAGLLGIETFYPEHTPAQVRHYLDLCKAHDLVPTGGSDFHGPAVRAGEPGTPRVPLSVWEGLQARAARARA
jgi:hypothetical protein